MPSPCVFSKTFAVGEVIFAQGDAGDCVYVVRKGRVSILRRSGAISRTIAVLGPGELIGEMAVATGALRSATARADVDCVLTVLPREEIDWRMEAADPILKLLLLTAFERLRAMSMPSDERPRISEIA